MPRYKPFSSEKSKQQKTIDKLYASIQSLRSRQEIINFFCDLLSESESLMLARRLEIARMLQDDKTYQEIRDELGAGFDTINTISRWLEHGHGGYQNAIRRLSK